MDHVSEPSEYDFRDGIIRIRRKDVELWKEDLGAKFTLVRFIVSRSVRSCGDRGRVGKIPGIGSGGRFPLGSS